METLGKLVVILVVCGTCFWFGMSLSSKRIAKSAEHERKTMQEYLAHEVRVAEWMEEDRRAARPAPAPARPTASAHPAVKKLAVPDHARGVPPEPTSVRLPCEPVPVTCEGPACYYDVRADVGACRRLGHGR